MITLGVDIGSLTGKALILKDNEILAWDLILTGPGVVWIDSDGAKKDLLTTGTIPRFPTA